MENLDVVILAAGVGSRLSSRAPKCLNVLPGGRTILRQQIDNIRSVMGDMARIIIVVGFECALIMEHAPDVRYVYNERFRQTNTNRSLLRALELCQGATCVWMNGDVVFDPSILPRLLEVAEQGRSAIAVNTSRVAEEEVKYVVDDSGLIDSLSKIVPVEAAQGESVGVNVVVAADIPTLMARLRECEDNDYFERGIELAIEGDGMEVAPVDISDLYAVEIDTPEDLRLARDVHAAALQGRAAALLAAPSDSPFDRQAPSGRRPSLKGRPG